MNLLLADPPAPSSAEQPTVAAPAVVPPEQPLTPGRTCANCGAELRGAQEWCLQCGAGSPGSLGASSWRGPSTVILALVVLVAGAAVAGAAALSRHKAAPAVMVKTVAQAPTPTTTAPLGTGTTPVSPTTPGFTSPTTPKVSIPKIPATGGSGAPKASTKVPSLPFFNSTPNSSGSTKQSTNTTPKETGAGAGTETTPSGSGSGGNESTPSTPKPTPILLDTNAASTYNPYGYPETNFGAPALAIDGDAATAWTARVDPAVAPRMAEGLVIDLKHARHLELLELHTTTPGATIEIYGSTGSAPPSTITDAAWTQLSTPQALKKTDKLKLHSRQKAYRFVLVWLTKAPAASVGTAQAPGQVALNELALFPLAS